MCWYCKGLWHKGLGHVRVEGCSRGAGFGWFIELGGRIS